MVVGAGLARAAPPGFTVTASGPASHAGKESVDVGRPRGLRIIRLNGDEQQKRSHDASPHRPSNPDCRRRPAGAPSDFLPPGGRKGCQQHGQQDECNPRRAGGYRRLRCRDDRCDDCVSAIHGATNDIGAALNARCHHTYDSPLTSVPLTRTHRSACAEISRRCRHHHHRQRRHHRRAPKVDVRLEAVRSRLPAPTTQHHRRQQHAGGQGSRLRPQLPRRR